MQTSPHRVIKAPLEIKIPVWVTIYPIRDRLYWGQYPDRMNIQMNGDKQLTNVCAVDDVYVLAYMKYKCSVKL